MQDLLLEFGVVTRRADYANGEIKLVIGNRHDARLFERNVGFWGAKQEKLERILDGLPASLSTNDTDRIPFLAEYVRSESGARGKDKKWLEKHSFDRIHDWERRGPEIMARVPSWEVQPCDRARWCRAGGTSPRWSRSPTPACSPCTPIRVDSDDHAFLAAGFVNHNTEARLAPLAMQLLGEIDEDTVDFTPTYDGNTVEPVVLPARFPNLLVNGGGGIAVGMATNIPPHNLGEVIDAVQHLLDNPDGHQPGPHAVRAGPRLPDRRADPRAQRDPRRLHDRARLDQDAGRRRGRGDPQGRPAHRR